MGTREILIEGFEQRPGVYELAAVVATATANLTATAATFATAAAVTSAASASAVRPLPRPGKGNESLPLADPRKRDQFLPLVLVVKDGVDGGG